MSAPRIAVVRAGWHAELLDRAFAGLQDGLAASKIAGAELSESAVPGALEIPLRAQRLARTGEYAAILGLALVVDGGIYRHEFVAQAVLHGIVQVGLATDVPVLSIVLTPHHFHEHETHLAFFAEHLFGKGQEAARALETLLA